MRRLLSLLLILTLPLRAEDTVKNAAAPTAEATRWKDADYTRFTPASFRQHPPALQVLDRAKLDVGLLNAAVFFATNAERARHKLPLLRPSHALAESALGHSRDMAVLHFFSYENPKNAAKRTAWQRMAAKGVMGGELAENIAMRTANRLTYLAFADEIVDLWMNSHGHRANILNRNLLFLGCGVHACACEKFHLYATQNFASAVP